MKIIQLFLVMTFFVGCTQKKIEDAIYFTYKDFGFPIELKGEILNNENIWKPNRIFFSDSVLITVDNLYKDYFVQIYNKDNLTLIAENVPKGQGPNESLNCWNLQVKSDCIWAFDMQIQKMTAYSKDDFILTSKVIPYKTVTFNDNPVGIVSLSNKMFVASSLRDSENLLDLYDENGMKINSVNSSYPQIKTKKKEIISEKRLFENRILYNEKNNKIVVFYVYTDLIDIYDEDLNLLSRIYGPDHIVPKLGIRNNFIHTIKETKFTYSIGYLTSNEIWALYYGVSPGPNMEFPRRIFVFDYNGKPLRSYNLEYPVFSFCIDENKNMLYGLSESPEICVIRFKL